LASTVKPDNVAERTFKIVRRPPDGLAYAISVPKNMAPGALQKSVGFDSLGLVQRG
jgi:hypothetical protein